MHSTNYKGIEDGPWTVHHNGDYSGDVIIVVNTFHPKKEYEDRVVFNDNAKQREYMKELIQDPLTDLAPDSYSVSIPFEVLKRIVADKIRMDMIERIEEMDTDEILKELIRLP